ncbi:hypothetical protein GOODEAATRI_031164, partial [Goodea atripinnis]
LAAVNLALYLVTAAVFTPSPSVTDSVVSGFLSCGWPLFVCLLCYNWQMMAMTCALPALDMIMLRVARLAQLCPQDDADLPPSGQVAPLRRSEHGGETTVSVPPSRRKRAKSDQGLATRVEQLSVEEDASSLAVSASQFRDEEKAQFSQASETGSFSSQSAVGEPSDGSMREVMCMALRQLQLELPLGEESASGSAFFRRGRAPTPFSVPPSEEYLRELQTCWQDPRALSRLSTDCRVLAAIDESVKAGLDRMPAVEPAVASLIMSPDEALRPDVRCPRTQCRVTDDLLCKAYNAGAHAGCLGIPWQISRLPSLHPFRTLVVQLRQLGLATQHCMAFELITRELGRVMSFLVQARRQVWLPQSPLTEGCHRTLRGAPAVVEPLERT